LAGYVCRTRNFLTLNNLRYCRAELSRFRDTLFCDRLLKMEAGAAFKSASLAYETKVLSHTLSRRNSKNEINNTRKTIVLSDSFKYLSIILYLVNYFSHLFWGQSAHEIFVLRVRKHAQIIHRRKTECFLIQNLQFLHVLILSCAISLSTQQNIPKFLIINQIAFKKFGKYWNSWTKRKRNKIIARST